MANPNIKDPAGIYGKTDAVVLTTSLGQVVANSAASGKIYKINDIRACNVSAGSVTLDVTLYRSSTHYYQAKDAAIYTAYSLVQQNKDECIWLEEGDAIYAKSNTANALHLTVSYEVWG